MILSIDNLYGDGGVSEKIRVILKKIALENILKKKFYNLKVSHEEL